MKILICNFVDSLPRLAAVISLVAISWLFVKDFIYEVEREHIQREYTEESNATRTKAELSQAILASERLPLLGGTHENLVQRHDD